MDFYSTDIAYTTQMWPYQGEVWQKTSKFFKKNTKTLEFLKLSPLRFPILKEPSIGKNLEQNTLSPKNTTKKNIERDDGRDWWPHQLKSTGKLIIGSHGVVKKVPSGVNCLPCQEVKGLGTSVSQMVTTKPCIASAGSSTRLWRLTKCLEWECRISQRKKYWRPV